jgi:ABC-type transporter MlaC component
MKTFLTRVALAAFALVVMLAFIAPAHGQAEKIKQKAKDVKKEVEGGQSKTNKPPAPPPPPLPPVPPKRTK